MQSGTLLGGKYLLVTRLGRGGMGEVWAAEDQHLGRRVAVKILLADLAAAPNLIARLRREARTAAALQHPGITVVHDIGEHEGHPFFVMELLEGDSFATLLAAAPAGLPVERAVTLTIQVCEALDHAHRKGVVHRDIKPANLMELTEGGVKICDFGISWYADATSLTATGGILGTPAYMAPEQYEGLPADARTDLYSLGCTLHALLTGGPPFTGPSPARLMRDHLVAPPPPLTVSRPDAPQALEHLVQHLLAKDPADRPASAAEVGDALRALSGAPVPPLGLTPRFALSTGPSSVHPAPGGRPPQAMPPAHDPWAPRPAAEPVRTGHLPCVATFDAGVGAVYSIAFSPDGALLAVGGVGRTVTLWDVAAASTLFEIGCPAGMIRGLAFSPDGAVLAIGGGDRKVRLWHLPTGEQDAVFGGHTGWINAVAFSPDAALLAVGGVGAAVKMWDVAAGRRAASLRGHGDGVLCVAFSPDGAVLAAGGGNHRVRLWNTSTGSRLGSLSGHLDPVCSLAFSPDGAMLATGGGDATVRLWEVSTRREVAALAGHTGAVRAVAYSPDGGTLATGGGDATVRLWHGVNGEPLGRVTHTDVVRSLAFSPDGGLLATGGDRMIRLWRLR